ncbi:DUF4231 domain-containing protein [Bradyrhizobium sp. USDA 4353]
MANGHGPEAGADFVARTLNDALRWSGRGQKWWSFANHGSTVCVVVFSATAAVLSQIGRPIVGLDPKTVATVLSLCVTIISTVQSKLGFERKWVANRLTHSALNGLLLDEKTGGDVQDIKDRLKAILEAHDRAIAATGG